MSLRPLHVDFFSHDPHHKEVEGVGGVSLSKALALAQASSLSYEQEKDIILTMKANGWNRARFINDPIADTQLFLAASNLDIWVVFRGTEQDKPEDWVTNLTFTHVLTRHGRIHKGFFRALNMVWRQIEETIIEFCDKGQNVYFSGHSLGGSLAVLAAANLLETPYRMGGVYTYGQPRTGDREFSRYVNSILRNRYFRFVNHKDIVPSLPLKEWGYAHCGKKVYLKTKGAMSKKPEEWSVLKNELVKVKYNVSELVALYQQYHGISTYIRKIKKNILISMLGGFY